MNFNNPITLRLTAIWALSEGFLGGFLHAAKIPFTGLVLGNVAVILITLISKFSGKNGAILKATLIVLIVKGILSPHTPFTAYLAVSLQGIIGELLFLNRKLPAVSAFLLGVLVSLFSSIQKIFFLTVVFGRNLWDSIDQFAIIIFKEFFGLISPGITFSKWLILIYVAIHLFFGILGGLYAARISRRAGSLFDSKNKSLFDIESFVQDNSSDKKKKSKHKRWWFKPSGIFFFIVSVTVFAFSYFYPELSGIKNDSVLIMVVRGILLMLIWYKFLSPLLLLGFKKFIDRKKNKYTEEIENVVGILPLFKHIVKFCWSESSQERGISKLHRFFTLTLFNLLTIEIKKL